jgi:response regulator RpfG family c-di-GMP phosphodiesterase
MAIGLDSMRHRPSKHMTGTPARILLVDDYVDALDMWALYLRSCGYEVLTATDGRKAGRWPSDMCRTW